LETKIDYDEDKFKSNKHGDLVISWRKQDKDTAGTYSYSQTFLPKKYDGGIIITHKHSDATNVALRVKNDLGHRYFDGETLTSAGVGNTKKVAVPLTVSQIDVYMAQLNKYDEKKFKDNSFEVTFTRASWADITALTVVHGGMIVWVIIGSVICLLVICLICLWKKCSSKDGA
jgi:hypothetical protein